MGHSPLYLFKNASNDMNNKIIALLLLIMLMATASCRDKDKIPREEMVSILVDIHLLDGALQQNRYRRELEIPDTLDVYEHVLENHGYTRAQFDSTLNYYSRDPRKFERIYQDVMARLNRMETRAREKKEELRRQKEEAEKPEEPVDSTKKANSDS